MKGINWGTLTFKKKCALPNESKLHIVQLHVIQKYMDIPMLSGAALKCTELQAIWCALLISALGHFIWSI